MRWILAGLVIGGLAMQGELWLSADGYLMTHNLRNAVLSQSNQNNQLKSRNLALEAEVINLKQHHAAAEERARTNLGMIGRNETFYQVVPATGDSS